LKKHDREAVFPRKKFKDVLRGLVELLSSLKVYRTAPIKERDYDSLANSIAMTEPFTIILFTETLASEHARRKEYVETLKHGILSELDETVFSQYGNEINEKMAAFLRRHKDPKDIQLNRLIRQYYPEAKKILRRCHPLTWERDWKSGKYTAARIRIEHRRKYDMPEPLCWGRTIFPQQFYFMRTTRTYARGCSSGSGTREAHSYFGLAFIEMSKRISIPSYILVYDRDNVLRFVARRDEFLIIPDSMGSNCEVDFKIVSALVAKAWKVTRVESPDYSTIKEIRIFR